MNAARRSRARGGIGRQQRQGPALAREQQCVVGARRAGGRAGPADDGAGQGASDVGLAAPRGEEGSAAQRSARTGGIDRVVLEEAGERLEQRGEAELCVRAALDRERHVEHRAHERRARPLREPAVAVGPAREDMARVRLHLHGIEGRAERVDQDGGRGGEQLRERARVHARTRVVHKRPAVKRPPPLVAQPVRLGGQCGERGDVVALDRAQRREERDRRRRGQVGGPVGRDAAILAAERNLEAVGREARGRAALERHLGL